MVHLCTHDMVLPAPTKNLLDIQFQELVRHPQDVNVVVMVRVTKSQVPTAVLKTFLEDFAPNPPAPCSSGNACPVPQDLL